VSLNEVCKAQYRGVLRRLRGTGWEMRGRFVATKTRANNCPVLGGKRRFGNAVLTRNGITWARSWALPHRDGSPSAPETRKLLCVTTPIAGRATRVCSTHITHKRQWRKNAQIRKVKRIVTPWVRSRPVVLMGDFNVRPWNHALDRIYSPSHGLGAFGRFQEADENVGCRCGESTSGSRKIDYVFLSSPHWAAPRGDATHSDISDHDPLRGSAARQR
jgi:endonuclease/exonuclease/phosphatase family metal-dependent hydrolase